MKEFARWLLDSFLDNFDIKIGALVVTTLMARFVFLVEWKSSLKLGGLVFIFGAVALSFLDFAAELKRRGLF